ncbi:MAG: replicative DNA helicase, partial [Thermotogae bacterium]
MIQKVPPHNLEAEEAVLGSIFIDPGVVNDVMEILRSDDFYLKKHQLIFSAIEKLYDAAEPIDVLSVCEQLKQSKKMAAVGTELEVARLAESVPTSAHALHYAQIVRDKSILRSLISTASDIVESAYGEEEVDEILDRAEKQVFEIAESRASKTYQHIGAIMHNIFEKLESVRENSSSVAEPGAFVTGIPTGLKSLDKQTTGFHEADLVIVAARPSVGKTALALTIARNMAIRFN